MATEMIVTSLQQSLSSASRIPTDIKFSFKVENDGATSTKEIKAHKFILALVSDVFEKGLYGEMKEDDGVEIKDVTHESFEAMIKFIYSVNTDINYYECEMICSLYYLGDKYNINALKKEALSAISGKDILAEEVLDVCVLADQYSVHEELYETLQIAAAQSLSKIFAGDLAKAIDFFNQIDINRTPISGKSLVQIMARVKKIKPTVCQNCKSIPCLTGVGITRENFLPGAKVEGVNGGIHDIDKLDRLNSSYGSFDGLDTQGRVRRNLTLSQNWYVYKCLSE